MLHPVWTTDCHQLVFPPQGVQGSTEALCPPGRDFHGKHSEPLGMTNPYLVVASDEGLSGSYCGSAVHFQVRVVILRHKHLQDVQHLETIKMAERQWETEDGESNTERGKEWLRFGLSLKGLEQINITWTEIPTGRVSGSLWGIISLVLTATAGASLTYTLCLSLTYTRAILQAQWLYEHNNKCRGDIYKLAINWKSDRSANLTVEQCVPHLSRLSEEQDSMALFVPETQQRLHHYQLSWAFPKAKLFLLGELVLWDSPQ